MEARRIALLDGREPAWQALYHTVDSVASSNIGCLRIARACHTFSFLNIPALPSEFRCCARAPHQFYPDICTTNCSIACLRTSTGYGRGLGRLFRGFRILMASGCSPTYMMASGRISHCCLQMVIMTCAAAELAGYPQRAQHPAVVDDVQPLIAQYAEELSLRTFPHVPSGDVPLRGGDSQYETDIMVVGRFRGIVCG